MREISTTRWQRQGSSVVFDKGALGGLAMISLREALGWIRDWPQEARNSGSTVMVVGLDACMEVLDPPEAEGLLCRRVKPFVVEFQSRWDQAGLVFGCRCHETSFQVNPKDETLAYVRRDGARVRFSESLWDGGSTLDLTRIIDQDGEGRTLGYWVQRIS